MYKRQALDTSRLKTIIGEETGLDPRNVGGFVMGEHGDSQFTAWSTVSLGGKPFARFLEMCIRDRSSPPNWNH